MYRNFMNNIVETFLNEKGYRERKDILGIILYGSSIYHTATHFSDIDLLIITENDKNYKGLTYIENQKIEYFERNIYDILQKIETLDESLDRSLISIFTNGKTLFSKYNTVENITEDILCHDENVIKKKRTTHSAKFTEFYNLLQKTSKDSPLFNYFYYNLLEEIRKEYHREKGFSKLPATKILELYSNEEYATKYYCVILPSREFRNIYLTLLTDGYEEETFTSLLSTLSPKENQRTTSYQKSRGEIKYQSTVVNTSLDKYLAHKEEGKKDSASIYYLALEKIRSLYCNIQGLDSCDIIDNEYEEEFQMKFLQCLTTPKEEHIRELFQYVTEPLNMNYKEYKVYELTS